MARVVARDAADADATQWPVPVREFAVSGHIAVALASESEMREEWTAMRNCALEYISACRRGTHRALSLRDRESGERIVTIILKREGGRFVVLDARRRFNRPAGPELWLVAQRAAAVCNGATGSPRLRRAANCRKVQRSEFHRTGGMLVGSQATFDFGA
jgi:hypothetical protein